MKMKNQEKKTKFITKDILKTSIIGAFQKLNPKYMMKNPVMFVVEVGFVISMIIDISRFISVLSVAATTKNASLIYEIL